MEIVLRYATNNNETIEHFPRAVWCVVMACLFIALTAVLPVFAAVADQAARQVHGTQPRWSVETGHSDVIRYHYDMFRIDCTAYDTNECQIIKSIAAPRLLPQSPLIPDFLADVSIVELDGTFYAFATTDAEDRRIGRPTVWQSKDFVNWSFKGSIFPEGVKYDFEYWAPSAPVFRNGLYHLFPTFSGRLWTRIVHVVADSVVGPYRAADGSPIGSQSSLSPYPLTTGKAIDAEVFIDDDDQAYMVWAQRGIAKLSPDLTAPEGEQIQIKTKRIHYSEGPILFKRNGIYYYLYTQGGFDSYQNAYMMSRTSPLGPWEAPENDIIATTDLDRRIYGPGHGCVFNPKGTDDWYFVCLEYGRGGKDRQIHAAKMEFNEDGTITPVTFTLDGVGPLRPLTNPLPNLARGKVATASSVRPQNKVKPRSVSEMDRTETFVAANALDESNGTRWMAPPHEVEPWFMVDLGDVREIGRTLAYFVLPTFGHAYRLESSHDGNTWEPYGGHEQVVIQSPHEDIRSVHARYLKLTILKGAPGLWEFKVYER